MIAQARANPWISLIDSDRHGPYHQGQYTAIRVNEVCFSFTFAFDVQDLSIVHYHVVLYSQTGIRQNRTILRQIKQDRMETQLQHQERALKQPFPVQIQLTS